MTRNEYMTLFLIAIGVTFALTVVLCRAIIPVLRARRIGQHIFTEAVSQHAAKEGTPTMGGVCFILPMLLVLLLLIVLGVCRGVDCTAPALAVCLGVANGMIGFVDDYAKLCHKGNQGLTSKQKLLLQIIVASLYLWAMSALGKMNTVVEVPFLNQSWDMGIFYYIASLIIIVGVVNSTNLTDGIDGLASSVTLVACMGLSVLGFLRMNGLAIVGGSVMIGGMIGFLLFNFHPAKVFMGDTGSLYLGGFLIGIGFSSGMPLLVLLLCMVFVLDMLTSLIQIVAIRVFHRRVFKIAPVHHQFQLMGWGEERIVYAFSAAGLLFAALAVLTVI